MKTEYLSIKDFAEKAGVSQQSLYKRLNKLNNQLNNYVKVVEKQKMIDIRALQEVYGVEVEQPIQSNIQPVEQPIQPLLKEGIKEKDDLIKFLKDQLNTKDMQIENLQATNDNLIKQMEEKDKLHHDEQMNLQRIVEKEQELNARNQAIIKELEEKNKLLEVKEKIEPVEPDKEPPKGFWKRFFRK